MKCFFPAYIALLLIQLTIPDNLLAEDLAEGGLSISHNQIHNTIQAPESVAVSRIVFRNQGNDILLLIFSEDIDWVEILNPPPHGNAFVLEPGDSSHIDLQFTVEGLDYGEYYGEIELLHNDPETPHFIPLILTYLPPPVQFDPPELEFDHVPLGTTQTLPLTVRNEYPHPVHIQITRRNPQFQVTPVQQIIPAGGQALFAVSFTPEQRGTVRSYLQVQANADISRVDLRGSAATGIQLTSGDYVHYPSWVINDSTSENACLPRFIGLEPEQEYRYKIQFYQRDRDEDSLEYFGQTYDPEHQEWIDTNAPADNQPRFIATAFDQQIPLFFRADGAQTPGNDWWFSVAIQENGEDRWTTGFPVPVIIGCDSVTCPETPEFWMGWVEGIFADERSGLRAGLPRKLSVAYSSPPKAIYMTEPNGIDDGNPETAGFFRLAIPADSAMYMDCRNDTTGESIFSITEETIETAPGEVANVGSWRWIGGLQLDDPFVMPGDTAAVPVWVSNPLTAIQTLHLIAQWDTLVVQPAWIEQIEVVPTGEGVELEYTRMGNRIEITISSPIPAGVGQPLFAFHVTLAEMVPAGISFNLQVTHSRVVLDEREMGGAILNTHDAARFCVVSDLEHAVLQLQPQQVFLRLMENGSYEQRISLTNQGTDTLEVYIDSDRLPEWLPLENIRPNIPRYIPPCTSDSLFLLIDLSGIEADNLQDTLWLITSDPDQNPVGIGVNVAIQRGGFPFDLNDDLNVDLIDLQLLLIHLGGTWGDGRYQLRYDLDQDGVITFDDVERLLDFWNVRLVE